MDRLEPRNLMASISLEDGVLRVIGTERNDHVYVYGEGTQIVVRTVATSTPCGSSRAYRFDAMQVRKVFAHLGAGDDFFGTDYEMFYLAVLGNYQADGTPSPYYSPRLNLPVELHGGAGNDQLRGGSGYDRIFGGAGNDQILGSSGDDLLDGGSGNNVIHGGAGNDVIQVTGSRQADQNRLYGGSGNNFIVGGHGHDVLVGGGDDDVIYGGNGDDQLWGAAGNDYLAGQAGNDWLYGDKDLARDRWTIGIVPEPTLTHTSGNDILAGGPGNDAFWGGPGNDVLRGGRGIDLTLFGVQQTIGENSSLTLSGRSTIERAFGIDSTTNMLSLDQVITAWSAETP